MSIYSRNWLGTVVPGWDGDIEPPSEGFTTKFTMKNVTNENLAIPLVDDFADLLADGNIGVAMLALMVPHFTFLSYPFPSILCLYSLLLLWNHPSLLVTFSYSPVLVSCGLISIKGLKKFILADSINQVTYQWDLSFDKEGSVICARKSTETKEEGEKKEGMPG
jgi:hypothetical protein